MLAIREEMLPHIELNVHGEGYFRLLKFCEKVENDEAPCLCVQYYAQVITKFLCQSAWGTLKKYFFEVFPQSIFSCGSCVTSAHTADETTFWTGDQ